LAEVVGDRLLAEDMLACLRRLYDEVGVGVGGGADQDRFDLGIGENRRARFGNRGDSAACRQRWRSLAVDVRDSQCPDFRQTERQRFGMHFTDPPGADDSDVQLFCAQGVLFLETIQSKLASMERRYWRLRRAPSFGLPLPGRMSCSTRTWPAYFRAASRRSRAGKSTQPLPNSQKTPWRNAVK